MTTKKKTLRKKKVAECSIQLHYVLQLALHQARDESVIDCIGLLLTELDNGAHLQLRESGVYTQICIPS